MRENRGPGGRGAFFGLAMLILGGLLFAAGVMVGRQLALREATSPPDPLVQIHQRDKEKKTQDGGNLVFPEVLDDQRPRDPVPVPLPAAPATPAPAKPETAPPAPSTSRSLQVAAYRELSQAEDLKSRLQSKGYPKIRIVEGEVSGKGRYYRVRLGPFSAEQADRIRAKLERDEKLKVLPIPEYPVP